MGAGVTWAGAHRRIASVVSLDAKHRLNALCQSPQRQMTQAGVCFHPVKITHALILLYFVFLLATLWWGPRFIQGPWLFLLRAFFPNWKFFHAVGDEPRLYVRCGDASGTRGAPEPALAWHLIYPRRHRSLGAWGHNPHVNLALSQQNLVDHLAHDLNHLPAQSDARDLVAYRLVQALAREACVHQLGALPGQVFEFEIRLERSDASGVVASHTLMQAPAAVV